MKTNLSHILLFIFTIFIAITMYFSCVKKENFTPSINMIYRPHIRTIRKYYDYNIQSVLNKFNNALKRYNIINIYR
jgi:hypothetical protein